MVELDGAFKLYVCHTTVNCTKVSPTHLNPGMVIANIKKKWAHQTEKRLFRGTNTAHDTNTDGRSNRFERIVKYFLSFHAFIHLVIPFLCHILQNRKLSIIDKTHSSVDYDFRTLISLQER